MHWGQNFFSSLQLLESLFCIQSLQTVGLDEKRSLAAFLESPCEAFKSSLEYFLHQSLWLEFPIVVKNEYHKVASTLVYRIDVHARLLNLRKNSPCTALFWSARLLILRKKIPLHVYLGPIKVWNKVIQVKNWLQFC